MIAEFQRAARSLLEAFLDGALPRAALENECRKLDVSDAVELGHVLSFLGDGCWGVDVRFEHIAKQLAAFTTRQITASEVDSWLRTLEQLTSAPHYATSRHYWPELRSTVRTVRVAVAAIGTAPTQRGRAGLETLLTHLRQGRPLPGRRYLSQILHAASPLRWIAVNPPTDPWADEAQWLDIALKPAARTPVQLIPLSLFTRAFFRERTASVLQHGGELDPFYFHPENDSASLLRHQFPSLTKDAPQFSFFNDANGLAEIVFDVDALSTADAHFALHIFCTHHGVDIASHELATFSAG